MDREGWKKYVREKYGDKTLGALVDDLLTDMPHLERHREVLGRITQNGKLDRFNVVRALRNSGDENIDDMVRYLDNLDGLAARGIDQRGINQVLGDLAAGGNKKVGTDFMFKYMDEHGLWDEVEGLEEVIEGSTRRFDLRSGGTRYEFKSIENFNGKEFLGQFEVDVQDILDGNMKWVFDGSKMERDALIKKIEDAIDASVNIDPRSKGLLKDSLDDFIIVE